MKQIRLSEYESFLFMWNKKQRFFPGKTIGQALNSFFDLNDQKLEKITNENEAGKRLKEIVNFLTI